MNNIIISVSDRGEVNPDSILLGHAGEHNVSSINFSVSEEIANTVDYFRVDFGGLLTERLYPDENGVIVCPITQSILTNGSTIVQLEGIKISAGKVLVLFKSDIIKATILYSVSCCREIPNDAYEPFESAVSELENLLENAQKYEGALENAERFASASQEAMNGAVEAMEIAENSARIVNSGKEACINASQTASEYGIKAVEFSGKAENFANQAESFANKAETFANKAEADVSSIQGLVNDMRDNMLVYKNDSPNWESMMGAFPGSGFYGDVKIIESLNYAVRIYCSGEATDTVYLTFGEDECISQVMTYNPELSAYEAEFKADYSFLTGSSVLIRWQSEWGFIISGKIEIYCKDNLLDIVAKLAAKIG